MNQQCKSTHPTKSGAVFCVERSGHGGEHRGNRKRWSDRLWLLELTPETLKNMSKAWEPTLRVIVRANTKTDARKMAATVCGDECSGPWLSEEQSTCKEIFRLGKSGVVMVEKVGILP